MKTILPLTILLLLSGIVGWTWHHESDNIKTLVGLGEMRKSILEDIAYWCWPAKWEQYQQERLDRQAERAANN